MNTVRFVTMSTLVLLLLAAVSIPTAFGSQGESPIPSSAGATATYSGDDDYDPAAGGTPEQSVIAPAASASPLVDCTLSPNEIAARRALTIEAGFSGDDDYDPAAGGMPELSVIALAERSALSGSVSYSGDDDYDPAAGGTPELSLLSFVQGSNSIARDSVSSGN